MKFLLLLWVLLVSFSMIGCTPSEISNVQEAKLTLCPAYSAKGLSDEIIVNQKWAIVKNSAHNISVSGDYLLVGSKKPIKFIYQIFGKGVARFVGGEIIVIGKKADEENLNVLKIDNILAPSFIVAICKDGPPALGKMVKKYAVHFAEYGLVKAMHNYVLVAEGFASDNNDKYPGNINMLKTSNAYSSEVVSTLISIAKVEYTASLNGESYYLTAQLLGHPEITYEYDSTKMGLTKIPEP